MIRILIYSELRSFFCNDVGAEYFAKGTENFKIVSSLFRREERNLVFHACGKTQELGESDKEIWTSSSYPFRHKTTVHSAERVANRLDDWTMQHLKLFFVC